MISKLCALLVLSAASVAVAQEETRISWLPDQPLMPVFTANATAHRMSITRLLKNNQYIGGMGRHFPVVAANIGGHELQFGVGATFFVQLLRSQKHLEVVNGDFYVDFILDYQLDEERIVRAGLGHTSQHLFDDAYEILGYGHSINYVRDYYQVFLLQKITLIRGFVYAGFLYHRNFKIPEPGGHHWLFQIGSDGLNEEIATNLYVYLAADIKFRQEAGFATTQNYQIGLRLRGNLHSLRLAYAYRTGLEERGQFYNQRIHWNTLGLFFEF